jgi:hypothetical protein
MIATLLITATTAARAAADPPERVARISFLAGTVSFRSAAATEWSPAALNYPMTIGDHVWTDRTGRLELEMGATAVDLDAMTAASVLNLDHHIAQLRVLQGTAIVRVRELADDESLEIDTPNGAMTLVRPGLYRIDVQPSGETTTLAVRRGDAEIAAGASAFPVHVGQSVTMAGLDAPTPTFVTTAPLDEFDDWVFFRDRRAESLATVRYVPRTIVGYEDLDEFGAWRVVAEYGPVWVPHVRAGWAPYRFGHWAWVEPWGWTWIDDAPWGFAPFHYGRWAYVGDGWAWVPGAIVARPVYAPALVAFVGGSNWRIGVGIGAPVGWFPLGPREVFVPSYGVSPAYFTAVNRPHVPATTVNVNVNVTNITYVNHHVPGALTVVSRETFVNARPVAAAAVPVTAQALNTAVVVGHAAPREIAPVALTPVAAARSAAVVAPPPSVTNRAVVVRTSPPAGLSATAVRRIPDSVPAPPHPANVAAPTRFPALPAPPPVPAPAPPAAVVTRAAPDRATADVAARHAQERADVEARHAAERANLQARQLEEARRAASAAAQADARARQAHEQAELDARQKREHADIQKRQEAERRGRK